MEVSSPHRMGITSSFLPRATWMAVRSASVAATVTVGAGRSVRPLSLGGWPSVPVNGVSVPLTATTGSVFGLCVRNS